MEVDTLYYPPKKLVFSHARIGIQITLAPRISEPTYMCFFGSINSYIGDGHPTLHRESLQWVYKLLQNWVDSNGSLDSSRSKVWYCYWFTLPPRIMVQWKTASSNRIGTFQMFHHFPLNPWIHGRKSSTSSFGTPHIISRLQSTTTSHIPTRTVLQTSQGSSKAWSETSGLATIFVAPIFLGCGGSLKKSRGAGLEGWMNTRFSFFFCCFEMNYL